MSNQQTETPDILTNPSGETAPSVPSNPESTDWELQLAQAYQEAEALEAATQADQTSVLQAKVNELSQLNESLSSQLLTARTQLEDMTTQHRRLAADFDNYRKRTQKEKEELDVLVKCNTLKSLLPVIDNFERARSHIKPQNESEMTIHKSYQSVYKQMVDCLKQIGVSPMRPEGQPFDPNLHEALLSEPSSEHEEGTVLQELERGYTLGDRVLRHAKVKVSTPSLEETPTETEAPAPDVTAE